MIVVQNSKSEFWWQLNDIECLAQCQAHGTLSKSLLSSRGPCSKPLGAPAHKEAAAFSSHWGGATLVFRAQH